MTREEFIRLAKSQGHCWVRVYRMDSGQVKVSLPGFETEWGSPQSIFALAQNVPVVVHKDVKDEIRQREKQWDF